MTESPSWFVSPNLVPYPDAVQVMEERVDAVVKGSALEHIWLLEHPPLYTSGTSSDLAELLDSSRFPVFETGRGGRYTYHGPGQRVIYPVVDLRNRGRDVRKHVWRLEEWVIQTLADFYVTAERRQGRVGLWVTSLTGEEKIAAIGVRVRKWVTYHGLSLNVDPDLSHFSGVVPCGLPNFGVTSLKKLGVDVTMADVDASFKRHLPVLMSGLQA